MATKTYMHDVPGHRVEAWRVSGPGKTGLLMIEHWVRDRAEREYLESVLTTSVGERMADGASYIDPGQLAGHVRQTAVFDAATIVAALA